MTVSKSGLTKRLVDLAYASTRRRLVRVLLELAEEQGVREGARMRINLPLSLGDLAEMIGASRQATCEELRMLRAEGLIEVAWPRVFLADVEHLRQLR
ncbi:winged helix-turn-helix domain-containing protein [Candidatus Bipolaricaulota bacterium]|nr:winged helix-turn-helix domain-containing protein [Candidatus Bipolaricaulota bacterium]